MRRLFLMCLVAVLLTAGVASAVTWNPTDANSIARGYSNWNVVANWGTALPDTQGTATFQNANRPVCWVTGVQICPTKFAMGDSGGPCRITIKNGGSLSLGAPNGWNAIGYNGQSIMTVEKGGFVTSPVRVMLGRNGTANGAPSQLIVDGGTFQTTGGALQMGESTAWAQLFVNNEGLVDIKTNTITYNATLGKMLIDVGFGTIILNGDRRTDVTAWKAFSPPRLVGFGGKGTVASDYNVTNLGKTTITGIHPMIPSPTYGSTVFEGTVSLSWKNMDPNKPGDPVYVDVWCGTEPNKLNPVYTQYVTKGTGTTTVNVTAPVVGTSPTTYYWQVDSYIYGTSTGTPIAGDVFKFKVSNDFPPTVVIDTPVMATWANQAVAIDATITDNGSSHSPVTYTWTSSPAGVVFSNQTGTAVTPNPDTTAAANPATFPTTYTLTCSVKDTANPTVTNTATRNMVVYETACKAARRTGAPGVPTSDVDGDCDTDITDLYNLLSTYNDWMTDYTILAPTVIP